MSLADPGLTSDLSSMLGPAFEESRQVRDITKYLGFVVETDPKIQIWRATEKEIMIETLTRKAHKR